MYLCIELPTSFIWLTNFDTLAKILQCKNTRLMEKDRISTFLVKMPVWKICTYLHVYLLFLFAMTIINIYLLMKSLWPNEWPIIKVILKYLINKWRQKKLYTVKTKKFREIQEYKFNFTNFFIMPDFGTHPL